MLIRPATPADAAGIHAIYAPIVEHTAISFELQPPGVDELARRIVTTLATLPWLVAAAADGTVAGYVYASRWRERAAYQWSVEVTAYVHEDHRGQGLARRLYGCLFAVLAGLGYRQALAGITLPNDASVALHEALGFVPVARFPEVGCKHGAWRDVGYWQRELQPASAEPQAPRAFDAAAFAAVAVAAAACSAARRGPG